MEAMINADEIVKSKIIRELRDFGCCDLCILRYLGNTDPHIYRLGRNQIQKVITCFLKCEPKGLLLTFYSG